MRHLAMALVAVLAVGACSDDDEEESADADERSDETPEACDAVAVFVEWNDAVEATISGNEGNPVPLNAVLLDGREEIEAAYSDLADTVPEELRDNAEAVGDVTIEYLDLLADGTTTGDELIAWIDAEEEDADAAWGPLAEYSWTQCDTRLSSPLGP